MRTVKEALEDGSLSLEDEIDYADMTEEDYKKEIERLKKREQECIDHYLVQCKYASEMEDKYITANNIINEFEDILKSDIKACNNKFENMFDRNYRRLILEEKLEELQELKGSESNE